MKIEADAMMMERLLNNTIKYSQENQDIFVRCMEKERKVAVEIIDTGPVAEENHLPYLFDAFYRPKQDTKGSGLGLAIAKRIVELHKGKISARLSSDVKTVFHFFIPRNQMKVRKESSGKTELT